MLTFQLGSRENIDLVDPLTFARKAQEVNKKSPNST